MKLNIYLAGAALLALTFMVANPSPTFSANYGIITFSLDDEQNNEGESGSEGSDCLLGDVNLWGDINLLDVGPFVAILISGGYQCEADINEDGLVDLLDVAPFVALFF